VTLVREALGHPTGLSIDFAMDHTLYWVDTKLNTIESVHPDGTARRTLARGVQLRHPVASDVFEGYVFWLTRDSGELLRQDKFGSGLPVTLAKDLLNPSDIKGKSIPKTDMENNTESQPDPFKIIGCEYSFVNWR